MMQKRKKKNLARPKDRMVKAYLEPLFERLSQRAREEVIEHFCRPRCGKAPSEGFCLAGRIMYGIVLRELMYRNSSLN